MADSLVTDTDLEEWLGVTFDAVSRARAVAVINAVSSLVRSEAGLTWEGVDVPEDARTVTLQVAARVYLNPNNVQQESIGSYSYSYGPGGLAGLDLTAAERRIIRGFRTSARGLWSQSLTRDDRAADTEYVPVVGTPNPFPWYSDDVTR